MKAEQLLRLYPREWRQRYGDEFLAVAGETTLTFQQVIDIVSGAIDARLSSEVRRAARVTAAGGGAMTVRTLVCRKSSPYTTRDAMIAAAVMIGATAAFSALGLALKYSGWTMSSTVVLNVAFFASTMISLPFWLMKGQPWKAQAAIVAGTLLLLTAISILSVL